MTTIHIITNRPTQKDLEIAYKEGKMVLTFIHIPDTVIDRVTFEAFQAGWLLGLDLKPDYRLSLIMFPKEYDIDYWSKIYIEKLEESAKSLLTFKYVI